MSYYKNLINKHKARYFCYCPEIDGSPSFEIYLTNKCNLKCPYCSSERLRHINGVMKLNDFIKLLNNIKIKSEIVLMGGEPTLHPDFIKICELCTNSCHDISILTNGCCNLNIFKCIKQIKNYTKLGFEITCHNSALKCIDKFINNINYLKNNNFSFIVKFSDVNVYKIISKIKNINLYQFYIDDVFDKKICNTYENNVYNLNGKIIDTKLFQKLNFNFKNWLCLDNIVHIDSNGDFYQSCGNLKGNINNYVFDNFHFTKCTKGTCESECLRRLLKIKC